MTNAERAKIYRDQRQSKGICTIGGCGKPLRTKWLCDDCSKKCAFKNNRIRNKKRLDLINNGICSQDNCGKPLDTKWLCRPCADKTRERYKKWYIKNIDRNRITQRKHLHKYRFNGLRPAVIERDKNICQICFRNSRIVVHHINENNKDNRMDNLICLCFICHVVIERMNRTKPNLRHLFPWFH